MSVTRADREASLKKRYAGRVAAAPKRRGMGRGPGPGAPRGGGRPKSTGAALKRLLSYLEADRLRMGIAFFCVIVNTVATLTGSYMLRPIINRFIAPPDGSPGDVAGLFKGLTMMACVYLLGVIANYLQSRLMLEVAQSALVRIRTDLFTKMQKLPVRFYDTNSNGDLMSRFTNDVDTIGNMLSSTLVQLFSGTLSIIGTLFLMLYTNIWLTAVTLIMIPLMLRAGGEVAKRSQKYFSAQQSALGALNGYIEETITGQKVVKVFCHEEIAEEEFDIKQGSPRKTDPRPISWGHDGTCDEQLKSDKLFPDGVHRRDPLRGEKLRCRRAHGIFELFETVLKTDQRDLHAGFQRVLSPCRSGARFLRDG